MGRMTVFSRWRVYLDSNFFIRFVESRDDSLLTLFEREATDLLTLHTSELTLAEVLVEPVKLGDKVLADEYSDFLAGDDTLEVVPISRDILSQSAQVRATIGNKLPDAIHVATATACSCNVFVSSDKRLRLPEDVTRVALEDVDNLDVWP
jgi:predicted nucleic acid-binding protein